MKESSNTGVATEPKIPGTAAVAAEPVTPEVTKNLGFNSVGEVLSRVLTKGTGRLVPVSITVNVLNDNQIELVEWPRGSGPISHGIYDLL